MNHDKPVSRKIILLGTFAVGKTSLSRRFVHDQYASDYAATLGVKIDTRTVDLEGRRVEFVIWDIADLAAGEALPESYFAGTQGAIHVVDLTRPSTFLGIEKDMDYLDRTIPDARRIIVGNKIDLLNEEALADALTRCPVTLDQLTSAKTGEGVEEAFLTVGRAMMS